LKDYFRSAGEITYTNVHNQRQGEGIVEFANRRGMDYALDHKDELELDGRRLRIHEERRSRSRSNSRDRNDNWTLIFPSRRNKYFSLTCFSDTLSLYFYKWAFSIIWTWVYMNNWNEIQPSTYYHIIIIFLFG